MQGIVITLLTVFSACRSLNVDFLHFKLYFQKEQRQRHNSNDDWEIPEEEVEMGERIGSGSYGTVFKAQWHGTCA